MLRLLSNAVNSKLSLAYWLENWQQAAMQLRERPRRRNMQIDHLANELNVL